MARVLFSKELLAQCGEEPVFGNVPEDGESAHCIGFNLVRPFVLCRRAVGTIDLICRFRLVDCRFLEPLFFKHCVLGFGERLIERVEFMWSSY